MSESFIVINGACQQFTYAGVVIDAIYKIILGVLFELFFGEPIIFDDDLQLPYCTSFGSIQPLQLAGMDSGESMYFDSTSDTSTFSYLFLLQSVFGVLAMAGIASAAYDYSRRRG